jgi:hypothetical protein
MLSFTSITSNGTCFYNPEPYLSLGVHTTNLDASRNPKTNLIGYCQVWAHNYDIDTLNNNSIQISIIKLAVVFKATFLASSEQQQ